jgi:hypothetical protein
MRRKFSTLLEESLYDRTRSEAIRQHKQIADLSFVDRASGRWRRAKPSMSCVLIM